MIATEYGLPAVGGRETFDPHENNLVVLTTLDGLGVEPRSRPEGCLPQRRDPGTSIR